MENNMKQFTSVTKTYNNTLHSGYRIEINSITSFVPLDTANKDYQAIQKWIAEGGEVIDNPPTE